MKPFATIFVRPWGTTKAGVVGVGPDGWVVTAVRGPVTVSADDVEVSHLVPMPRAIVGTSPDGNLSRVSPAPRVTEGAEFNAWRQDRRVAILRAVEMGWTVRCAK